MIILVNFYEKIYNIIDSLYNSMQVLICITGVRVITNYDLH